MRCTCKVEETECKHHLITISIDLCIAFLFKSSIINYNNKRPKKHFKNEQRSRDAAAKKELIQVE